MEDSDETVNFKMFATHLVLLGESNQGVNDRLDGRNTEYYGEIS